MPNINRKLFRKQTPHRSHKLVFIVLLALLGLLGLYFFVKLMLKPVAETPKTMVKKIPQEVKDQYATPSGTLRVPILLYHYVENVADKRDIKRQSLNINPYIFDSQLKTLSESGYTFMTASELGDVLDGKKAIPTNPILLTFDDGHWDLYTDVLPILKKHHAKATAYIISGFIGGSDNLDEAQLKGVIDSGLVEIGAHTVHHIALGRRALPLVEYEVNRSKAYLHDTYNLNPVSFAYPDGSFDLQAISVVKSVGFTTAVSTIPGVEQSQTNKYFLFRIRPGARTGEDLLKYLKQLKYTPW